MRYGSRKFRYANNTSGGLRRGYRTCEQSCYAEPAAEHIRTESHGQGRRICSKMADAAIDSGMPEGCHFQSQPRTFGSDSDFPNSRLVKARATACLSYPWLVPSFAYQLPSSSSQKSCFRSKSTLTRYDGMNHTNLYWSRQSGLIKTFLEAGEHMYG